MCYFQAQNGPFVLNKIFLVQTINKFFWYKPVTIFFLVQTIIITFMYLLALFIVQNLKKFLQQIQSSMCHFWVQNCPFALNKFFFGKLLKSFSSTYQPLSLCKIFKKFFMQILSNEDVQFLGPKWPISPNENFFRKPLISLVSFIHA